MLSRTNLCLGFAILASFLLSDLRLAEAEELRLLSLNVWQFPAFMQPILNKIERAKRLTSIIQDKEQLMSLLSKSSGQTRPEDLSVSELRNFIPTTLKIIRTALSRSGFILGSRSATQIPYH